MFNWKDLSIGVLIGTVTEVAIRLSGYEILPSPIPRFFVHTYILLIYGFTRQNLDPKYAPFKSTTCKPKPISNA